MAEFRYSETTELAINMTIPEVYNKTLTGVNPAAIGIWHSLKTAEDWRLQVAVLYGLAVDGLGEELANQVAYGVMHAQNFETVEGTKKAFWPTDKENSVD